MGRKDFEPDRHLTCEVEVPVDGEHGTVNSRIRQYPLYARERKTEEKVDASGWILLLRYVRDKFSQILGK